MWQHFSRKVWTLTVTVHGPCLWQVCCSAKTLQSPPFISRTPNSWRFLQRGQRFPLLSYIFPLPDICQFYVRGLGMPVIVLQHENDVNFPTGPFLWDADGKAADNSWRRCQHITSFTKLLPCSSALSAVPRRVIEGEKRMMSSFQRGSKSQSYYASALSCGRWWWWWW